MTDMTESIPQHMKRAPDLQFLAPEQVADRLGMSPCTPHDLRRRGGGRKFLRFVRFSTDSSLLGRSLRFGFDWFQALRFIRLGP